MRIGGFEKSTLIDYPGKIACMIYTIGCNFRCPYCHNPELVDETAEEIKLNEVLEFMEKRKGLLDGIVITGGEPTLHDDLPDIVSKFKKIGYDVKLDTNGTNPDMLKKLINSKLVDYIAMDIKSPLEAYSENVARPVHADDIKKSIDIIIDSPIDYEFRTTVVKSLLTPEDLEKMAKEIKGAKAYFLQKFNSRRILNPQFKKKVTYTDEEFEEIRKKLLNYVKTCSVR